MVEPARTAQRSAASLDSAVGGWLLVTAAVLSFGQGTIHPYYTVVLAPANGARWLALGRVSCGAARDTTAVRILLVSALLVTVVWAWAVLARTPDFVPWLRVAVVVIGLSDLERATWFGGPGRRRPVAP